MIIIFALYLHAPTLEMTDYHEAKNSRKKVKKSTTPKQFIHQ